MTVASTTVADGRKVSSYTLAADSIAVGEHRVSASTISILPGCEGNGAEGLLGMNFLKEFRYHIDYNRSVIEWGS